LATLIALQVLLGFRGVNRIANEVASMDFRTPSIQPKQSASSTDSGQVRLGFPEPRRWKPTQSSVARAWCASSHARKRAGVAKNVAAGGVVTFVVFLIPGM
jgi:hypothetical protein